MTTEKAKKSTQDGDIEVREFMRHLTHPLQAEMEAVLTLIRSADAAITEGIKWNAPSFRLQEYFATVHVREKSAVQVILHLGAKVRDDVAGRVSINDSHGLLQWLGKDRASVKFHDMKEIKTHGDAFQEIVRQWITHLRTGVSAV